MDLYFKIKAIEEIIGIALPIIIICVGFFIFVLLANKE